eukprot:357102-Chlamydomonas_euryale.AAC.10
MPPQLKEVAGVLQRQHLRKSYTLGDLLAKLQLDKCSAKWCHDGKFSPVICNVVKDEKMALAC